MLKLSPSYLPRRLLAFALLLRNADAAPPAQLSDALRTVGPEFLASCTRLKLDAYRLAVELARVEQLVWASMPAPAKSP